MILKVIASCPRYVSFGGRAMLIAALTIVINEAV